MSWEAMLPLGIISAMFFVMGTSQFVVHKAIYGKVLLANRISLPFIRVLSKFYWTFVVELFVVSLKKHAIGLPKHPRHDAWDRAMDERDARVKEEAEMGNQK